MTTIAERRRLLRRDLLTRHAARTDLPFTAKGLESAAVTVCCAAPDRADARGLLLMIGLLHPDGPAPSREPRPVTARSKPVPNAHRKRDRHR
jgi:hypothetical protein